jgi:DNA-binding PadR family transcriptional regulator
MTKRRRVNNLLALAVLSLTVQRPMHPYEMASMLRVRSKDQDMAIKWGSLYTVVRNMAKHGLIEAVASERHGARPERTVYRITDEGRAELDDWARELISTPEPEHPRFKAGLSVMGILPPDVAATLLADRLAALEAQIAAQRHDLATTGKDIPRLFLIEVEYELAIRRAEATWLRGLIDELTSGSFPGLAHWRAFHDTGELPAELADLAERGSTSD